MKRFALLIALVAAMVIPASASAIGTPTGFSGSCSGQYVALWWNSVANDPSPAPPISGYYVQKATRATTAASWSSWSDVYSGSSTSTLDTTGATNGTTTKYRVRAGTGTPLNTFGSEADFYCFDDEFNSSINTTTWNRCRDYTTGPCAGYVTSDNQNYQCWTPDHAFTTSGYLRLQAERLSTNYACDGGHAWNTSSGWPWKSGYVETGGVDPGSTVPPGFAFTYGHAEIRAKLPAGDGFWIDFSLYPYDYSWPPDIQLLEAFGYDMNTAHRYVHPPSGGNGGAVGCGSAWIDSSDGGDMSQTFHTYSVDWSSTAVTWKVDGIHSCTYSTAADIAQQPLYVIMALAVGSVNHPPTGSTPSPANADIEYVRVATNSVPNG